MLDEDKNQQENQDYKTGKDEPTSGKIIFSNITDDNRVEERM
jgi:hypothetical protein